MTLSVELEHISRQAHNVVVFLKTWFSHKMASATKWFRNAVSFKMNRFMPLSQTIYRKQCLLHFELRGCIVSKKRKKPSYARDILTVAFNFAKPPFEFGSLCFECWVLSLAAFCMGSSAELFLKARLPAAALIKPVLEGDHSDRGLTLELWVQALAWASSL